MDAATTASAAPLRRWLPAGATLAGSVAAGWLAAAYGGALAPRLPSGLAGWCVLSAGLATLGWLWARPAAGAALLVAFVYLNLSQLLVRHFDVPSLLRLLVLALLVAAWRTPGPAGFVATLRRPLTAALALYTAVVLASTLWATDPAVADLRFWELGKAFVLYVLLATLLASPAALRRGAWTMTAGGALLGGLGVWQQATGSFDRDLWGFARVKVAQIYGDVFEPRIAGPLGDPNFFAQILVLALPVAVTLALREGRSRARWAAGAAALLIAPALVLTYSRGAGLALAVELVVLIALSRQRLRAAAAALAAVALVALLAPAELGRRFGTFAELLPGQEVATLDPDSSFGERRLVTRAAWEMFQSAPLTGVGAGNYPVQFTDFADRVGSAERFYDGPGETHYPHSLYLEIAAETGIPGIAAFALVLTAATTILLRARTRLPRGGLPAALAVAFTVSLAGYLTSSLFLHGHFLRYLWLIFGFSAALGTVAAGDAKEAARGD